MLCQTHCRRQRQGTKQPYPVGETADANVYPYIYIYIYISHIYKTFLNLYGGRPSGLDVEGKEMQDIKSK